MNKSTFRKSFEFILVFLVILVSIFLLEFFKSSQIRVGIITSLVSFYVVAGAVYHFEKKNLKFSQILEYLAVGTLMFIILSAIYH